MTGAKPFTRGHVYKLLSNPLYIGRVRHRSSSHPGQHEPIIDMATWTAVQTQLADNTQGARQRRQRAAPSPPMLADRLLSAEGHRFIPTHATKGARRYRYYVESVQSPASPRRLPARGVEQAVIAALRDYLRDRSQLLADLDVTPKAAAPMLATAATTATFLDNPQSGPSQDLVEALVSKVVYRDTQIELHLPLQTLRRRLGWRDSDTNRPQSNSAEEDDVTVLRTPLAIRRRGQQLKLTLANESHKAEPSSSIANVVARARDWALRIESGSTPVEIAEEDLVSAAYVSHVLHLAYLSPSVVELLLNGQHALGLTADELVWRMKLPFSWERQPSLFAV